MNIHNPIEREQILGLVSENGSPDTLSELQDLLHQYTILHSELKEDGNLTKYAACSEYLQRQINRLIPSSIAPSVGQPSLLFLQNTTVH